MSFEFENLFFGGNNLRYHFWRTSRKDTRTYARSPHKFSTQFFAQENVTTNIDGGDSQVYHGDGIWTLMDGKHQKRGLHFDSVR